MTALRCRNCEIVGDHRPPLQNTDHLPTATAATGPAVFPRCHRTCFSDGHVTAAVFSSVEFLNSISRFLIRRHFHKAETFTTACVTIGDDLCGLNTSRLREDFLESLIRCAEREIADV